MARHRVGRDLAGQRTVYNAGYDTGYGAGHDNGYNTDPVTGTSDRR